MVQAIALYGSLATQAASFQAKIAERCHRLRTTSNARVMRTPVMRAKLVTSGDTLLHRNRGKLRLFLDTADIRELYKWLPSGLFFGVTTNPTLLERANVPCTIDGLAEFAIEGLQLGAEEVHIQAWGGSVDDFLRTSLELTYIDPRIVIKLPATREGVEAAHLLVRRGVRVTLTAVYEPHQVVVATSIGADYAAPYLNRMNLLGKDGEEEIISMKTIAEGLDSTLRILVASVKSADQVASLALNGIDTFALPPDVAELMLRVDETEKAAGEFERAAKRMNRRPASGEKARAAASSRPPAAAPTSSDSAPAAAAAASSPSSSSSSSSPSTTTTTVMN